MLLDLPPAFTPIPDDELAEVLATALRRSGGNLTRYTQCWLATVSAEHLVRQLALEGLVVVRRQGSSQTCWLK